MGTDKFNKDKKNMRNIIWKVFHDMIGRYVKSRLPAFTKKYLKNPGYITD